jgi:hypothetical protein
MRKVLLRLLPDGEGGTTRAARAGQRAGLVPSILTGARSGTSAADSPV